MVLRNPPLGGTSIMPLEGAHPNPHLKWGSVTRTRNTFEKELNKREFFEKRIRKGRIE